MPQMKIIVKYFGVWGNSTTKGFNLDNDATVDDLMDIISKRFVISRNNQLLKYTKKIGNVRVTVNLNNELIIYNF